MTTTATAIERCEESRAGYCDTHEARWPHERPCCIAVDLDAFWKAQVS